MSALSDYESRRSGTDLPSLSELSSSEWTADGIYGITVDRASDCIRVKCDGFHPANTVPAIQTLVKAFTIARKLQLPVALDTSGFACFSNDTGEIRIEPDTKFRDLVYNNYIL